MTKQELIKAVAQAVRTAHPDRDVSAVMVETVLDALGDVAAAELLGGGEIPLPGLGKLKAKILRPARDVIREPGRRWTFRRIRR